VVESGGPLVVGSLVAEGPVEFVEAPLAPSLAVDGAGSCEAAVLSTGPPVLDEPPSS